MTQTDLARAMKSRGHGFHQQTIQRIETGERPVRIEEAFDLAEILDSTVQSMSERIGHGLADLVYSVDRLGRESRSVQESMQELIGDWIETFEGVGAAFLDMHEAGSAGVPTAAAWVIKALRVFDAAADLDQALAGLDTDLQTDWHEYDSMGAHLVGEDLRWVENPRADAWRALPEEERPEFLADLNAAELAKRSRGSFVAELRDVSTEEADHAASDPRDA